MELLPIIQLSLYIFSGLLAVVMLISYISYKINSKNKPTPAMQSMAQPKPVYRQPAPVQRPAVQVMPQAYQMPQQAIQYVQTYDVRPSAEIPVESYRKPVINKRVMVVNRNNLQQAQSHEYSRNSEAFESTQLRAAVSFR